MFPNGSSILAHTIFSKPLVPTKVNSVITLLVMIFGTHLELELEHSAASYLLSKGSSKVNELINTLG